MNNYWLDLLERTARTFVQGFLAVVTLDALTDFSASWLQTVEVGAVAGAYAILSSFAAKGVRSKDSASFVK